MENKEREKYVFTKSDRIIVYAQLALAALSALCLVAGLFLKGVWDQKGNFYSVESESAESVEFCSKDFGEEVLVKATASSLEIRQGGRTETFSVDKAKEGGADYFTFTDKGGGIIVGIFSEGKYAMETDIAGSRVERQTAPGNAGAAQGGVGDAFTVSTAHIKMVRGDVKSKTQGMEASPLLGLGMMGFGIVLMALKGNVMASNSMGRERREEMNKRDGTTKSTLPPKATQVLYSAVSVAAFALGAVVFVVKFVG